MKRHISRRIITAISVIMLISCVQDEMERTDNGGKVYTGSTEQSTKTVLGDDCNVLWQEGDLLSIFSGSTSNCCYKVTEGTGTSTGRFELVKNGASGNVAGLTANIAIYPYDEKIIAKADGTVEMTLPKRQNYIEGGFAQGANPMAAVTPDADGNAFDFKNLCSIVRLSLTGSDVITSLEFSGNNQEKISGPASLKPVFGEEPVLTFANDADTLIVLDCGQGVYLSSTPTEFHIVVPPTSFTKGFKVKVISAEGKAMELRITENLTLKRSKIKSAPAVVFKGTFNDGYVHFEGNEALEKYCLEEFDLDGDGKLSKKEASRIKEIDLSGKGLKTLIGLENLPNLENMTCNGYVIEYDEINGYYYSVPSSKLTGKVDLSGNKKLKVVSLQENEITDLVLSDSCPLTELYVSHNLIKSLNIKPFKDLTRLICGSNQITSIDLSENVELFELNLSYCKLGTIDLSNNTKLSYLYLYETGISSIDLSCNKSLVYLGIAYNSLTSLDISMLSKLENINAIMDSLRFLIVGKDRRPSSIYVNEKTEIITDDCFRITPESFEAAPGGDLMEVEILSLQDCHISSVPDWVTVKGIKKDGIIKTISLLIQPNNTGEGRRGDVVLCSDGGECHSLSITQKKIGKNEPVDWKNTDFHHRSLVMRFTGTWCSFCPMMAEAVEIIRNEHPDKIEAISMHDGGSTLYFQGCGIMQYKFGINAFPTGIIDCRRKVKNTSVISNTAGRIFDAVMETENNYKAVTGISFVSKLKDNKIDVDVSVYAKAAEQFRIAVVLLEDKIVAEQSGAGSDYVHNDVPRLNLSQSMEGDLFTVSEADTVIPIHYSGIIPSGCVSNNCRVLVYILRQYGNQTIVREDGYWDWYVDNCVSGKAGGSTPLQLPGNGSSHLGDNEDITPGSGIDF